MTRNWDDNVSQTLLLLLDRFTKQFLAKPVLSPALYGPHSALTTGLAISIFPEPAVGLMAAAVLAGASLCPLGKSMNSLLGIVH
jgi:hypothetical protein